MSFYYPFILLSDHPSIHLSYIHTLSILAKPNTAATAKNRPTNEPLNTALSFDDITD